MVTVNEFSLSATAKDVRKIRCEALVLGVVQGSNGPVLLDSGLSEKSTGALGSTLVSLGVSGKADEVTRLPGLAGADADVIVLTGLGREETATDEETLRRAAGAAIRNLMGVESVVIALPAPTVAAVAAIAEGAALGAYVYTENRHATAASLKAPVSTVTVHSPVASDPAVSGALSRAEILGKAVNATRTLVNRPPSHLYPETFATAARELARSLPVKVTVFDEKKLEKDGYGGLMGVGKGSSRPPRMVKVEYSPSKPAKKLALVGKGITFDSGGLSLKPPAGMETMKCDMAGAAVALNALLAIAELGLPIKVTAWLCIAENMPSGTAQRPTDVMTTYGGRTVEVLNTDAEGRLVMADGIAAASEEGPDILLDVATLTGAQMVALGKRTSAVMGDESVRTAVAAAANRAGELFWAMPIPEELRASLNSQVADIANVGEKMGGMMTAAAFLREFVGETNGHTIPWGHLDIAGPAFNEAAPHGYTPKEGTGVAVRTLVAYAEDLVSNRL